MEEINRESFVFYRSFFEAATQLDESEQAAVFKAICNFALNGQEPELKTGAQRAIFTLIKPQLIANEKRYRNGKKGGRPTNQNETETKPNQNQTETKVKPNDNQTITKTKPNNNQSVTKPEPNVNVNVNDNVLDDILNNKYILSINTHAREKICKIDFKRLEEQAVIVFGVGADDIVKEIEKIILDLCQDNDFAEMFATKSSDVVIPLIKNFFEKGKEINNKKEYVRKAIMKAKRVV